MKKVLVTGGCGYIGSHTLVDLIENGFDPVCLDNNSRSNKALLDGVSAITKKEIHNHKIDLRDYGSLKAFFETQSPFDGIIHFAAFKDVNESVEKPLTYMDNNLISLINLIKCSEEFGIGKFIFSSSCSVYGNVETIPVTEATPLSAAESPYGLSKKLGEEIIQAVATKSKTKFILLRYFNPGGAHPSIKIGEIPLKKPSNLVPAITFFAAGKLSQLKVFGGDYDTRDGSCIRDFIHVCDIAHAHTLCLDFLNKKPEAAACSIYNLGTERGVTVLETIKAFEEINNKKLNYEIAPRREGDVVAVYSDSSKAFRELGWKAKYSLQDIMETAWKWELKHLKN